MAQKLRIIPLCLWQWCRRTDRNQRQELKRQYRRSVHKLRRVLEDFFYRETQVRLAALPQFIQG